MISDRRIVKFLSESPLKSVPTMLDTLRYLDEQWIPQDLEYELFNEGLGDKRHKEARIRGPEVGGMAANALLAFTWHAKRHHMIRRRTRNMRDPLANSEETVVFYELTPAGRQTVSVLEAVEATLPGR